MDETIHELKELLVNALNRLYEKDQYLLKLGGNEMSLAFRVGIYFQELIESSSF